MSVVAFIIGALLISGGCAYLAVCLIRGEKHQDEHATDYDRRMP